MKITPSSKVVIAAPVVIGVDQNPPLTQDEIERIASAKFGCYSRTEVLLAQYVLDLQASLMEKEARKS